MKPLLTEEECDTLRRRAEDKGEVLSYDNETLQSAAALGARKQRERDAGIVRGLAGTLASIDEIAVAIEADEAES